MNKSFLKTITLVIVAIFLIYTNLINVPESFAKYIYAYDSISKTERAKYQRNFKNYVRKRILEISGFDDNFLQTHHITYRILVDSEMNIRRVSCESSIVAWSNDPIYKNTINFIENGGCSKTNNLIYDQLKIKQFNPNYFFYSTIQVNNFPISLVPANVLKLQYASKLIKEIDNYYTAENDKDEIEFEINFSRKFTEFGENWHFISYRTLSSSGNEKFNNFARIALKRANPIFQNENHLLCFGDNHFVEDSALGETMSFRILFKGEKIYYIDGKDMYSFNN